jgi:hypothetical protein
MSTSRRSSPLPAILSGGLVAGVLDLAGAYVIYRPPTPMRLLQSIAAGIFGNAAFDKGMTSATVGLLAHFVVAFGAATVFVLARRHVALLRKSPYLVGPIYGLGVWLFMNYVVIPSSTIGRYPAAFTTTTALVVLLHMVGVGLPIAVAAKS